MQPQLPENSDDLCIAPCHCDNSQLLSRRAELDNLSSAFGHFVSRDLTMSVRQLAAAVPARGAGQSVVCGGARHPGGVQPQPAADHVHGRRRRALRLLHRRAPRGGVFTIHMLLFLRRSFECPLACLHCATEVFNAQFLPCLGSGPGSAGVLSDVRTCAGPLLGLGRDAGGRRLRRLPQPVRLLLSVLTWLLLANYSTVSCISPRLSALQFSCVNGASATRFCS